MSYPAHQANNARVPPTPPAPEVSNIDKRNQEWIRCQYKDNLIGGVKLFSHARRPSTYVPPAYAIDNWPRSYRVNLAEMQRMRIQRLQYKLAYHARDLYKAEVDSWEAWEKDLQDYIQAVQEHDYMQKRGGESRDPFLITGERQGDRDILDTVMKDIRLPSQKSTAFKWEMERISPVATRRDKRAENQIARLGVATIGAAFLIAPMWLCILVLDTLQALWMTTIFVAVFGIMMAFVLPESLAVLSATAAYAAVLVVFVALVAEKGES
ncbi:hypothetical protein CEP53_000910 [Fusarium sp. AF-6]|nr:hypothetical protein CEP53_000910 [Fusarium sp. AF-6]